jgi:hypothetical protein
MLAIGTRVYILFPLPSSRLRKGVIYDYLPWRKWPYHVRPDGWPEDKPGLACTETELEPIEKPRSESC